MEQNSYFNLTDWIVSRLRSTEEAPNMTGALGGKIKTAKECERAREEGIIHVNVGKQILLPLLVQSLSQRTRKCCSPPKTNRIPLHRLIRTADFFLSEHV